MDKELIKEVVKEMLVKGEIELKVSVDYDSTDSSLDLNVSLYVDSICVQHESTSTYIITDRTDMD